MNEKAARNHELRKALVERLREEQAEDLIGPMENCGELVGMICTCCGYIKDVPLRCKKRYCPACQPKMAAEKVARWKSAICQIQWPLFLTLTMTNSRDPESIHYIKKRWSAFRRRKLMKTRVKGGVATFEITNKGSGWHPHIHAIMDCRWLSLHTPEPLRTDPPEIVREKCSLAQRELSALWADQLKQDHAIVDVRRVYDIKTIALEVLKYAMKGTDLIESPDPIAPLLRTLKNTRMLAGWGSMFPLPALDPEEPPVVSCPECDNVKSFLPEQLVSYLIRS
jgi:hypothetical protein